MKEVTSVRHLRAFALIALLPVLASCADRTPADTVTYTFAPSASSTTTVSSTTVSNPAVQPLEQLLPIADDLVGWEQDEAYLDVPDTFSKVIAPCLGEVSGGVRAPVSALSTASYRSANGSKIWATSNEFPSSDLAMLFDRLDDERVRSCVGGALLRRTLAEKRDAYVSDVKYETLGFVSTQNRLISYSVSANGKTTQHLSWLLLAGKHRVTVFLTGENPGVKNDLATYYDVLVRVSQKAGQLEQPR
jgi:hypothetical protein